MRFLAIVVVVWMLGWLGAFLYQVQVTHAVNEELEALKKENETLKRNTLWSEELVHVSSRASDRCADVLEECMSFLDLNYSVRFDNSKRKRGNTQEGQGKGLGVGRKRGVEAFWKDACGGG